LQRKVDPFPPLSDGNLELKKMPPPQPIDNGQKSPNRLSVNGLLVARLFSKIVFYPGLHCQQCQAYLGELERLLPEFEKGASSV